MKKKNCFMPTCDYCEKSSNEIYVCFDCAKFNRLCDVCWDDLYPECEHIKMQCAHRTDKPNPQNQILGGLLD